MALAKSLIIVEPFIPDALSPPTQPIIANRMEISRAHLGILYVVVGLLIGGAPTLELWALFGASQETANLIQMIDGVIVAVPGVWQLFLWLRALGTCSKRASHTNAIP